MQDASRLLRLSISLLYHAMLWQAGETEKTLDPKGEGCDTGIQQRSIQRGTMIVPT